MKADIDRIIYSRKTHTHIYINIYIYKHAFFFICDSEAFISRSSIKECLSSSQHAGPLVAPTITVPHEALVKLGMGIIGVVPQYTCLLTFAKHNRWCRSSLYTT